MCADHQSPEVREATRACWRWARWALLWTVFNVLAGIFWTVTAFNRLAILKFPDFYLERNGEIGWLNPKSFFGFYRGISAVYLIAPSCLMILILGVGVRSAACVVRGRVGGKVAPLAPSAK